MDTLLARLTETMTPQLLGELERSAGLDHASLTAGVEAIGPLVQHGLAAASRTPAGLARILELLPAAAQPDPVGRVLHVYVYGSHEQAAAVERMVTLALGEGRRAVERVVSDALGFHASALTPAVTPLVLALLKNLATERGLDAAGIADLLQEGDALFLSSGNPAVGLVLAAAEAGRAAASLKGQFTLAEWKQIGMAPLAVAALVMAAAPQGFRGMHKEESAAMHAVEAAHRAAPPISIMTLAYPDHVPAGDLDQMVQHVEKRALLGTVQAAVDAVVAKDPAEAAGFRVFLYTVGQRVAEAAREHTVLGLGGNVVSAEEQAVLDELKALTG